MMKGKRSQGAEEVHPQGGWDQAGVSGTGRGPSTAPSARPTRPATASHEAPTKKIQKNQGLQLLQQQFSVHPIYEKSYEQVMRKSISMLRMAASPAEERDAAVEAATDRLHALLKAVSNLDDDTQHVHLVLNKRLEQCAALEEALGYAGHGIVTGGASRDSGGHLFPKQGPPREA